mmetsp:Transcript_30275/g.93395  ORF Transcript_30275/g.93395 Transcript_30275/m.93395 type:complete len:337 (-) Transcript_30275:192-1202(-)
MGCASSVDASTADSSSGDPTQRGHAPSGRYRQDRSPSPAYRPGAKDSVDGDAAGDDGDDDIARMMHGRTTPGSRQASCRATPDFGTSMSPCGLPGSARAAWPDGADDGPALMATSGVVEADIDSRGRRNGKSHSSGSSCDEPSQLRMRFRTAKEVLVARVLHDINDDPDQFDPGEVARSTLDDAHRNVVGTGWLREVQAVLDGDDDLESVRSYVSERRSEAANSSVFGAMSSDCRRTSNFYPGNDAASTSTYDARMSAGSAPSMTVSPQPGGAAFDMSGMTAMPPTASFSPTLRAHTRRHSRHSVGSGGPTSPLTERALFRHEQHFERCPLPTSVV